jgi:hypothetical protein
MSNKKRELSLIREQLLDLIKERAEEIRPQLGDIVPLVTFRLYRFVVRQVASGIEAVIYTLGKDVGKEVISPSLGNGDLKLVFKELEEIFKKLGIGILTFQKSERHVRIRIEECAVSYKTPNVGRPLCYFEGGLIAGVLEEKLGEMVQVTEIECCGMGHDHCEFVVSPLTIEEIFLEALKL